MINILNFALIRVPKNNISHRFIQIRADKDYFVFKSAKLTKALSLSCPIRANLRKSVAKKIKSDGNPSFKIIYCPCPLKVNGTEDWNTV